MEILVKEKRRPNSDQETKKKDNTTKFSISYFNHKWINLMEPDENFQNGKRLCIRGRDLKPIDPDIFKIDIMLTSLELSPDYRSCLSHKLNVVPQAIRNLTQLRELKLDTNDLKVVPSDLACLFNLERLSLSNNNLKTLPEELSNLKSLKSLHLAKNAFETIPICIFKMKSLYFLDMTSNKLTNLDNRLLCLSGSLLFLSVYDNYLTRLDEWIGGMKNLEQLWFGSNKLSTIPRELTKLCKLDWKDDYFSIILDGNPIDTPPISVCREGLDAIEKWYQYNP